MRNRNEFATSFWTRASKSLPPAVRQQYLSQLKTAERWELALDGTIDIVSRGKKLLARLFRAPRRGSAH
jgi:hypothetical protein